MLVQRFEPQGRRFTNFHYDYYNGSVRAEEGSHLPNSLVLQALQVDDLFVQQGHGARSNSGTWKGRRKHTVRSAGSQGEGQRKRARKKEGEREVRRERE